MGTGWEAGLGTKAGAEKMNEESRKLGNQALMYLIQIVSVRCSLIAQWAPAAVTPAPAAAGFGATPEA